MSKPPTYLPDTFILNPEDAVHAVIKATEHGVGGLPPAVMSWLRPALFNELVSETGWVTNEGQKLGCISFGATLLEKLTGRGHVKAPVEQVGDNQLDAVLQTLPEGEREHWKTFVGRLSSKREDLYGSRELRDAGVYLSNALTVVMVAELELAAIVVDSLRLDPEQLTAMPVERLIRIMEENRPAIMLGKVHSYTGVFNRAIEDASRPAYSHPAF